MVFYAEKSISPVLEWMDDLIDSVRDKIFYRVRRLEELGHELRRPEADFLRDGIYELRVRRQRVNYRLLYFFHNSVGVIARGCTKVGEVADADINRAIARRKLFQENSGKHTYVPPKGKSQ